VVDHLARWGVQQVFSVPGESFLAILDGLCSSGIRNTVARHEGAAAMMAEAQAKLTGRPGIALVTRGPGACNASAGIHVARHDSTPMLLLIGQVPTHHLGRDAFQEVDQVAFFAPLAKWAAQVQATDRLPEYLARAWRIAVTGRPGPVVLALPEDVLSAHADCADVDLPPAEPRADLGAAATAIADRLAGAARPLVIAGGPGWSAAASADLARVARSWRLPVAVPFRRQDYMDNTLPEYAGDLGVGMNPALAARLKAADCVLALGTRLGEVTTVGYAAPHPDATLIHVHADPAEIGRNFAPALAVTASAPEALAALAACDPRPGGWADWTRGLRQDYAAWHRPVPVPGALHLPALFGWLADTLPPDAIVTNGAGNYAAFLHRFYRFRRPGTQLAPTSGSMGYGLPAAIAAKLHQPDRPVVCVAGDGCLQMSLAELGTAAQEGLGIIVLVVNNARYGTIRMHQELSYPGRVSGTDLRNPDFAALVAAYGGTGWRARTTQEAQTAIAEALATGGLCLIDLMLDDEVLSTTLSLSEARRKGTGAAP
jgi:acetolactate synthase-1/2/3 large subunit